jgi:signal transduction histidine kinase
MSESGALPIPDGETATILVVDDEPLNRELIHALLPSHFRVVEAESGPDALELVEAGDIDIVLLDVMMPGMSGFDVCRAMKSARAEPFLPIILLTALSDQRARNTGLEAGADDFLVKPVNRRELMLRVDAFLRLRRQDQLIRRQFADLKRLQGIKDDLVALLVNDLRNPIAGIAVRLQLVLDTLAGHYAPFADDLRASLEATQRIKETLEQTLQVRVLEGSGLVMHPALADVVSLLSASAASFLSIARRRGIELRVASAPTGSRLLDSAFVQRALENLISNAIRYTKPGGDVVISAFEEAGELRIRVADRGPGAPDALKQSLAAGASSPGAPLAHGRQGLGLGLYLARLVAEAHGGRISAGDREGGGSVFDLVLRAS